MISESFGERIGALARRVGADLGDLGSGHVRWGIYSRAMEDRGEWPELLELVREEPDSPVASAVVVGLLEVLPDHLRMDYVLALPPGGDREYATNRARDLAMLERISAGSWTSCDERFDIQDWSAWLQLQAANKANDVPVLEGLSSLGKTKRIRAAAERRLRVVRDSG